MIILQTPDNLDTLQDPAAAFDEISAGSQQKSGVATPLVMPTDNGRLSPPLCWWFFSH